MTDFMVNVAVGAFATAGLLVVLVGMVFFARFAARRWKCSKPCAGLHPSMLSPSEVCRKYHVQNCHFCENLACCDNTSPAKALLQAACEALDDIPGQERREKLRKAIMQCACFCPDGRDEKFTRPPCGGPEEVRE